MRLGWNRLAFGWNVARPDLCDSYGQALQASSAMRRAAFDARELPAAIKSQLSFWRTIGFIAIIVLALYFFVIMFGVGVMMTRSGSLTIRVGSGPHQVRAEFAIVRMLIRIKVSAMPKPLQGVTG